MSNNKPKVTVVGAGNVGATTAQLLLLKDLANVVMVDVADGIAKGKALDLMHMRSNEHFQATIIGTGDYAETADSDIVVVTAGVPRKPGMTREDLIGVNSGIVRSVLTGALPASPDAVFIFVTNPLDVMTNLASQISGLPKERLFGMGGVLDTARFVYAISQASGASPNQIDAIVVGAHGEAMVPLPSLAKVDGQPLTQVLPNPDQQLPQILEATIQGGAAVVEFLQTGSAFYAPASSITKMVEAIIDDNNTVLSACAKLEGEYGIDGLYMCVPARLGKGGLQEVVELPISAEEMAQLQDSAAAIKKQLV